MIRARVGIWVLVDNVFLTPTFAAPFGCWCASGAESWLGVGCSLQHGNFVVFPGSFLLSCQRLFYRACAWGFMPPPHLEEILDTTAWVLSYERVSLDYDHCIRDSTNVWCWTLHCIS
jgi:hypothetical protein